MHMNNANSILPDTSNRSTVGAPAPLPLSHLSMTERFFAYDGTLAYGRSFGDFTPASVYHWALLVGLVGAPALPVIEE